MNISKLYNYVPVYLSLHLGRHRPRSMSSIFFQHFDMHVLDTKYCLHIIVKMHKL